MSIDVSKLRPHTKVRLKDGTVAPIRGSYMSPQGIAFTVKMNPGSICDRNVPLSDILEIIEEVPLGSQSA